MSLLNPELSPGEIAVPSFGGYAAQIGVLEGVGFWPRVGARIIDIILHYFVSLFTGLLFGIFLLIASGGHLSPDVVIKLRHTGITGFVFALFGGFAYHVIMVSVHGSTLGKRILSMTVAQEDGSPCRFKAAVIRELGYFVDALFFGFIGYLAMQKTSREQRHGDEWAETVVCKRSRIAPENLRGAAPFVMALMFAIMADSASLMLGLLLVLNS